MFRLNNEEVCGFPILATVVLVLEKYNRNYVNWHNSSISIRKDQKYRFLSVPHPHKFCASTHNVSLFPESEGSFQKCSKKKRELGGIFEEYKEDNILGIYQ